MPLVIEKKARNLIHPIDRTWEIFRFCPHRLAANIYLGCEFGCSYCFARAITPDYSGVITVRINAPEKIATELQKMKSLRHRQPVDLGSATDPYQPIEKHYELTRNVLKTFLRKNARLYCY